MRLRRDVGEDAREGRLYLPRDWFAETDLSPEQFLADPKPYPVIRRMTGRLLAEANRLYIRSEAGVPALPRSCRPGIFAARQIYAGIGRHVRLNDYDNFTHRARTGTGEKLCLMAVALGQTGMSMVMPTDATLYANPLPEVAYLVEAAARNVDNPRSSTLIDILAQLETMDRQATRA